MQDKNKITKYVEDVIANVSGKFADKTARDAKMQDIFAKQVGQWSKNGEQISDGFKFSQTDAYKFALSVNSDDFTMRDKDGQIHYFDMSDNLKEIKM